MTQKKIKLGVIGYGSRIYHVLRYLCKLHHEASVVAIVDPRVEEIKEKMATEGETRLIENLGKDYKNLQFFDSLEEMMNQSEVDGLLIGTRCNTHTDLAIEAMKYQIPLFLEKPVSTTVDQVKRLHQASKSYKSEAVISFPLRMSRFAKKSKDLVDAGEIGKVLQIEAYNHVTYGSVYFHEHYRDFEETGGLWLQKATHDLDVISYILSSRAKSVAAMHTVHKVFGGNKPKGLTCDQCDQFETCPESPFFDYYHRSGDDVMGDTKQLCAFGEDVGNLEDQGSALIEYECGTQVSYTQNFYVKNKPARGLRIFGEKGLIEFDYYTAEIHHTPFHSRDRNTIKVEHSDSHGGGDPLLAHNFIQVIRGEEKSKAPLKAGIESAYLCLYCRESADKRSFLEVPILE